MKRGKMENQLCFQCFKIKGDYDVCPHCGYQEDAGAAQAYQLAPGTVLRGRYIIGVSIGFGGFGITYKAFDTVLSIVVAVKEFYPAGMVNRGEGEVKVGIFSGDKEEEFKRQLNRFLEEARNMAIFSKEKDIINVFDYFEENQTAYIIMEYVDAPLLKTKLQEQGRFSVEEAKRYMLALLDALSKVHYHGIIHKDISPDNIFLLGEDGVKIFDFGAAKFQGTETERTVNVVVKAGYTPPEQYRSKNTQGAFMDIYAAGAVFYEMVTGEKPMEAPDRSVEDGLKKPSEFGVEIEKWLEHVIVKALALKPEYRFQTAEQFKNAIIEQKDVPTPVEIVRKLRRRKQIMMAGLAAAFFAVGGVLLLSQTYFSGKGKIDVAKIPKEELEIWLAEDDKETGEALTELLLESVEQECPQLDVHVEVMGQEEYLTKVTQAAKDQELPDVFCTEGIEAKEYCADLTELLNTMKLSSYLHLEGIGKKGVYELPTAMQIGVVYGSGEKETAFPESIDIEELSGQEEILGFAQEGDVWKEFQDKDSSVSRIAGDLSDMVQVKEVTVEMIPPTDFFVSPILKNGKLMGTMERAYGVNKNGDKGKQQAGMFLLSLLFSDGMQSVAFMENGEGIPLNRNVLEHYKENKMTTYLAFLRSYDLGGIELLEGDGMGEILQEEIGGKGK